MTDIDYRIKYLSEILDDDFNEKIKPNLDPDMMNILSDYIDIEKKYNYLCSEFLAIMGKYPEKKEEVNKIGTKIFRSSTIEFIESEKLDIFKSIISMGNLPTGLVTYRGTSKEMFNATSLIKGNFFTPLTYLSTSIDERIAKKFTTSYRKEDRLLIEIYLPENLPALWVSPISKIQKESELIIKKGIPFEIIEEQEVDGITKLIALPKNR